MEFSPSIMAKLPIKPFAIRTPANRQQKGDAPMFHWQGGYSAFAEFTRECMADNSPAGADLRGQMGQYFKATWSGIPESFEQWSEGGVFSEALKCFQSAEAKLESQRFQPGAPVPAVAGGSWVIPLVLTGNPMAARLKTRTKLPPKNLRLSICVASNVQWQDIARSVAAIARASWDYMEAGGTVRLVVDYLYSFRKPCAGSWGVCFSLEVPLTNSASFASACSAQQFRGAMIALAVSLSGLRGDSLPVVTDNRPGMFQVRGRTDTDGKVLHALEIKG